MFNGNIFKLAVSFAVTCAVVLNLDDYTSNFKRFGEVEGITGILHTSAEKSIEKLKSWMNENR